MTSRPEVDRLLRMNQARLRAPLSWVATTRRHPNVNLGDGLSAAIVAALSGLPVARANFDEDSERLVAVGTIVHEQKNGVLHVWGSGIDGTRNPVMDDAPYSKPAGTTFHVHATRGPHTAAILRSAGIEAPDVYGDPVWLLPRIWPMDKVEKTHELGVVLHISELAEETPHAGPHPDFVRYGLDEGLGGDIRIINTFCEPSIEAMRAKTAEVLSCRRIVSVSLHGLVIAEAYGVPCAWFATYGPSRRFNFGGAPRGKGVVLKIGDQRAKIDHRIADFYAGVGRSTVDAYLLDRGDGADWKDIMRFIDRRWRPIEGYDGDAMLRAFPLPLAVDARASRWDIDPQVWARTPF